MRQGEDDLLDDVFGSCGQLDGSQSQSLISTSNSGWLESPSYNVVTNLIFEMVHWHLFQVEFDHYILSAPVLVFNRKEASDPQPSKAQKLPFVYPRGFEQWVICSQGCFGLHSLA